MHKSDKIHAHTIMMHSVQALYCNWDCHWDCLRILGFTLLFLGLLGKNKGIYDLLECIRDHKVEFQGKLKLYIGGNGEIEHVKQLIKEYGIADIVIFEGWVSGDKKIELLNKSDAYILPSYKEGLPISILEAMSYGMPIISTPVGGIPEIVSNGENGYLVEPGNKEDIYNNTALN